MKKATELLKQNQTPDLQRFGGLILFSIEPKLVHFSVPIILLSFFLLLIAYKRIKLYQLKQGVLKNQTSIKWGVTKGAVLQKKINDHLFADAQISDIKKTYLSSNSWQLVQLRTKKTARNSSQFNGVLLMIPCELEIESPLIFKSHWSGDHKSLSKILQPYFDAQTHLKKLSSDGLLWNDKFQAFGKNQQDLNSPGLEKMMRKILNFNQQLKDHSEQLANNKSNRTFKSIYKTHYSPLEISFSKTHVFIGIKGYHIFPKSLLGYSKQHIQEIQNLTAYINNL